MQPLCFVLMPFGEKPDPTGGRSIDFDRVYAAGIRPAIEDAGLEPLRADEEKTGGIIHQPMFERLLLCDFAVADLTTANANVFYELGVRHAARPSTTVTVFATRQPIPFDVNFLRSLPYDLGAGNTFGDDEAARLRTALAAKLAELRERARKGDTVDSPLFQLVGEWQPTPIARLKTDTFREQVDYNENVKRRLATVREMAKQSDTREEARSMLAAIRCDIGSLDAVESGTAIDLLLTYRALSDWAGMIGVHDDMPKALAEQVLVQEQLGFALNRSAGDDPAARARALAVLEAVEARQGPSPETCGLIGRIHKDRWAEAREAAHDPEARAHLDHAIDAYLRGYFADQRDAYPGINAVTLLEIRGDDDSLARRDELVPVVRFAVLRRLEGAMADYWDYATMLELDVLGHDRERAAADLGRALAAVRESWEPETTANNLRMIAAARVGRDEDTAWLDELIAALDRKQAGMT